MIHIARFLAIVLVLASCKSKTLFELLPSSRTGIDFVNQIVENDSVNPIDLEFLYNGGGVAAADFNNDGLQDLYFTGSQIGNKLYLNKGNFKFADITEASKTSGDSSWANGASVVDINDDGLIDIYVSNTIYKNPARRTNRLYINEGVGSDGIPKFKESATAYGLADTGFSVQAAFLDYDRDGDLDMYLVQTKLVQRDAVRLNPNRSDSLFRDADKLFRNDYSPSLKHPVFTEVSREAGITHAGYGLGITVSDIDGDGWKDIYVTNDFYDNDLLYINNHNGTFSEKSASYFKHFSQNAMGNDIADINDDGRPDVIAVDMNPEDNYRKKKNMSGTNYYVYQNMMAGERHLQYVRNTLQLNMGPRIFEGDSTGDPVFADISYMSGIAETDWSWNPSIADFDNDGTRDIIITNGYPKDVTDHDFTAYRAKARNLASREDLLAAIPEIKVSNYAYRGTPQLRYQNVTQTWGMDQLSFSNGAVYADLDNDGDLDYVVNNINDKAFVYKNQSRERGDSAGHYLQVRFKGNAGNQNGIGARLYAYAKGRMWFAENEPCRGYLSCVPTVVHLGLGTHQTLDSVRVQWNSGKSQTIRQVAVDRLLEIVEAQASETVTPATAPASNLFEEVTAASGVSFRHREPDFVDFNDQRLLPHKLSEYGPALAAGDIDGNGLEDLLIGGSTIAAPTLLLQQANGRFQDKLLEYPGSPKGSYPETTGALLFDIDSDNDLDVYLASGSVEYVPNSKDYADQLLINDGKGNFSSASSALPQNYTSKSCVKAADFDRDGDLDLFIGGRVQPRRYPAAVNSFIYRNDSKNGKPLLTDISGQVAPALQNFGLCCDAIWTDYDNDGWPDLIVVGEWRAPAVFHNERGKLRETTPPAWQHAKGWWNSITGADFDNDGDIDYVAGNLGLNSYFRASEKEPMRLYAGDFGKNKSYIPLISLYMKGEDGQVREYPAPLRDDIVDQLPALKKKYLTYKTFAGATINDVLGDTILQKAQRLEANELQSAYIENLGQGNFAIRPLPSLAQTAPLYGMVAEDVNGDGNIDIVAVGNDYGTEVVTGRYDAMNGCVLEGDGRGNFTCVGMDRSGIYVPGNAKALVRLRGGDNRYLLAASQNKDQLKLYRSRRSDPLLPAQPTDQFALIKLSNGKTRRQEFYFGSSFLSQSSLE